MITQVYAQKFEDAFYACANPDLRSVRPPEKSREPERSANPSLDLLELLEQLQKSLELVNTLTALLSVVPSGK